MLAEPVEFCRAHDFEIAQRGEIPPRERRRPAQTEDPSVESVHARVGHNTSPRDLRG